MSKRIFVCITVVILMAIAPMMLAGCGGKTKPEIRVAGKNFNEQFVMAEMLSMLIEENTEIKTSVQVNLPASVIHDAIKSDQIDLYMEYTGTGLTNLGKEPVMDAQQVYEIVKKEFSEQMEIKWLSPLGFNNTYAMVVTRETAEKYGLKTTSDMAKVADEMIMGCTYVFTERSDGYKGLSKHYDFEFKDVKGMDASLMYQALVQGSVDVISGFTTDGRIADFDLVVLDDDKQFFLPYNAAIIVREECLKNYPQLEEVLERLAGRIDEGKMAAMNAMIDLEKLEPKDVARKFLEDEGLIGGK